MRFARARRYLDTPRGARAWWCGEQPKGHRLFMVPDREGAVEPVMQFDARLRITAPSGPRQQLETVRAEGDGVVQLDGAQVLEAEDGLGIEVGGPRAVRRSWLRGGFGESGVVARQEAGQEGVGGVLVPNPGQAQLGHEPVLKGAEEPLDAALGLRAGGGNPLDAQFLQEPADLGRGTLAAELFGQSLRGFGTAVEDPVAIGVRSQRDAGTQRRLLEDVEVPVGSFLVIEPAAQDFASSIVEGGVEDETRAAVFQPRVMTAIQLGEHAFLGHPLTPSAMPGWATSTGARDAGRFEDTAQRGVGHHEVLALGEQVLEVLVVGAGVPGPSQDGHTVSEGVGQAAGRAVPPVAVNQRGRAAEPVGSAQTSRLPDGEADQPRGFGHGDLPSRESVEDDEALLGTVRQDDLPHSAVRNSPGRGEDIFTGELGEDIFIGDPQSR